MSSQNQGRQSPEPENQTGAQQQDAPSSGKGVNDSSNSESNKETSKAELENLPSNPEGAYASKIGEKFSKTVEKKQS